MSFTIRGKYLCADLIILLVKTIYKYSLSLSLVRWRYLRCCDFNDFSVASCDAAAMFSLVHSFKSWNQTVVGLPLLRLPPTFPCINLFSIQFFRTMWPKNLIFLSAILFLNIKTDPIFSNTHFSICSFSSVPIYYIALPGLIEKMCKSNHWLTR